MIYFKSAMAGILALVAAAVFLYMLLVLVVIVSSKGAGFDLPRWHIQIESPLFWAQVIIVFAAGFFWEFRRLSN